MCDLRMDWVIQALLAVQGADGYELELLLMEDTMFTAQIMEEEASGVTITAKFEREGALTNDVARTQAVPAPAPV